MKVFAILLIGLFALNASGLSAGYSPFLKNAKPCCGDPSKTCKLHGEKCPCGLHQHNALVAKIEPKPHCHNSGNAENKAVASSLVGAKVRIAEVLTVSQGGAERTVALKAAGCGLDSNERASLPNQSKEFYWGALLRPETMLREDRFASSLPTNYAYLFSDRLDRPPRIAFL